jgi:putative DNA primase/helicase
MSRLTADLNFTSGHERTLLAAAMNGRNGDLVVTADDFFSPQHRKIFNAVASLPCSERNLLAVQDVLKKRGQLEQVGGVAAVTDIYLGVVSPEIVRYAQDQVLDASRERAAMRVFKDGAAGKITAGEAHKHFNEILSRSTATPEARWLTNIDAAIVRSSELASLTLTKRRPLLAEWLCEGDYGIIFAPRGVGKTWLALGIGKAVATGGRIGEWQAPAPAKVLYIDGEMPPDLMRDRDGGLGAGEIEFLNHAILFDRTHKVLNITEPSLQQAILSRCIRDEIRLVILDNLSTLASGIKENDSFEWERLHNWLLQFRRYNIAVILIHHAGRSGEIRGTSKREDAAFWIIVLDDANKHADDKRGARFITRFTKPSRNTQDEIPCYEWHVVTDQVTGEVSVECKPADHGCFAPVD